MSVHGHNTNTSENLHNKERSVSRMFSRRTLDVHQFAWGEVQFCQELMAEIGDQNLPAGERKSLQIPMVLQFSLALDATRACHMPYTF